MNILSKHLHFQTQKAKGSWYLWILGQDLNCIGHSAAGYKEQRWTYDRLVWGVGGTVKEQAVIIFTFSINKRTLKLCVLWKPPHDKKQHFLRIRMVISVFQLLIFLFILEREKKHKTCFVPKVNQKLLATKKNQNKKIRIFGKLHKFWCGDF